MIKTIAHDVARADLMRRFRSVVSFDIATAVGASVVGAFTVGLIAGAYLGRQGSFFSLWL